MMYLDIWRSGTFLLYSCKAAFWIQEMSPKLSNVECSVVLRFVFGIGSALAYLLFFRECATPPYVQVHHTTWLSFTRSSPVLVLQATNAGVRSPGYKAINYPHFTCKLGAILHILTGAAASNLPSFDISVQNWRWLVAKGLKHSTTNCKVVGSNFTMP